MDGMEVVRLLTLRVTSGGVYYSRCQVVGAQEPVELNGIEVTRDPGHIFLFNEEIVVPRDQNAHGTISCCLDNRRDVVV